MNRKKRNRIIVLGSMFVLILVLYFKPFSSTEIIILNHLTEINDGVEDQICLVINPPSSSEKLVAKINEFNSTHPVKGNYYHRLFIKEHDKVWFPALTLQENVDYKSRKTTSEDIDNIDFLATSYLELRNDGTVYKSTECKTGELWYYKK